MRRMMKTGMAAITLAGAALVAVAPALAQDWKAAVAAGQLGEGSDGYLGVVGNNPALARVAADINLQRKGAYTRTAAAATGEGATVQAVGIAAGCNLIKRLPAGAKYRQMPDDPQGAAGAWQTVGQGALDLDSRCVR